MRVIKAIVIYAGLTLSVSALGVSRGTNSGGGGLAVVCYSNSTIDSVELLDLWETKKNLNPNLKLEPKKNNRAIEEQVQAGIMGLKSSIFLSLSESHGHQTEKYLSGLLQSVSDSFIFNNNIRPGYFTPVIAQLHDVQLKLTPDIYEIAIPKEPCRIEQVVTFDDAGEIAYINMDLFELMLPTDQAALILHEAFYKVLRTYSVENSSIRARRAIGAIISGKSFFPIRNSIPKQNITCESADGKSRAYIYKIDDIDYSSAYYGLTVENIAGIRMLGYSRPSDFIVSDSLQDLYEKWLSKESTTPFSIHERPWMSAVDYDMSFTLSSGFSEEKQRKVYLSLNASPGNIYKNEKIEVICTQNN